MPGTASAEGRWQAPGDVALADDVGDADLAVVERDTVHNRARAAAARNRSARHTAARLHAVWAS